MTSLPVPGSAATDLSVETSAADDLRATVEVTGTLSAGTCPLLVSVLEAHQRAGRRYLRVDVSGCELPDRAVVVQLRARHAAMAEVGGLLVFDRAGDAAAALLRRGDLFVSGAA